MSAVETRGNGSSPEIPPEPQNAVAGVDPALFCTPESRRIVGGAGSGKTTALITRVLQLLGEGVAPCEILVLCATPPAADVFSSRLYARASAETENTLGDVLITTPRELAFELLSCDEARAWTGRPARLLASFEVNFLLEDMKTSGIRPRRLREMLKFFYRGWTELAEDDPDWLIMAEERQLHALLRENLTLMQGMLEPELSKLAVGFLRADGASKTRWQKTHVLVDDFLCLSRASQLLAHLLAAQSLTVAADSAESLEVFDSYPYRDGLDEFLLINPKAQCESLKTGYRSVAVTAAQNRLLDDESVDAETRDASATTPSPTAKDGSVETRAFGTPDEEFEGVAELVSQLLASGEYEPRDVGIVTLHRLWGRRLYAKLEERGLPVDSLLSDAQLTGDIRDLERSMALRVYTALRLVASARDAAAWRCWCGFGDYLANSAAIMNIKGLAQSAQTEDGGLLYALELLSGQPESSVPGVEKVLAAWRAGLSVIEQCQGLTGAALLERVTRLVTKDAETGVPSVLQRLFADCDTMGATDATDAVGAVDTMDAVDAEAMVARAERRLFFPRFTRGEESVRLVEPQNLCSLPFRVLIVCGFVNGFLPCRDYFDGTQMTLEKQMKTHAADVRLLYLMLGAAQDRLIFSHFSHINLEHAERLKLKIARIRMERGARVCLIPPSELLDLALGRSYSQ